MEKPSLPTAKPHRTFKAERPYDQEAESVWFPPSPDDDRVEGDFGGRLLTTEHATGNRLGQFFAAVVVLAVSMIILSGAAWVSMSILGL